MQFFIKNILTITDIRSALRFLVNPDLSLDFLKRSGYLYSIYRTSYHVDCAHTQNEILECVAAILSFRGSPQAIVVEAGCYKGGSTAKFSVAAQLVGRELYAFDSFEGLPNNDEKHGKTILGETPHFEAGKYKGGMQEVQANVRAYGAIECCHFIEGWFDKTMPSFCQRIAVAYIDVDLVSSTKTCLRYLYPLLEPGGSIYSQDAHLPLIIELLKSEAFWRAELNCAPPVIDGLGSRKLVRITKPHHSEPA